VTWVRCLANRADDPPSGGKYLDFFRLKG